MQNDASRIARSSSMSTLAGAGEEDSRIMHPTISSMNKMRGSQGDVSQRQLPKSASSSSLAASRREMAYVGSGTSSGETSPTDNKPELPPRTRSTSVDRSSARSTRPEPPRVTVSARSSTSMRSSFGTARSRSERDLSKLGIGVSNRLSVAPVATGSTNITVTKTSKHELFLKRSMAASSRKTVTVSATNLISNVLEKSPQELPVKDTKQETEDIFSAPLTRSLCEIIADGLKLSADNVLQLCKRISMDGDLPEAERLDMLNILSQAAAQAQHTLRPIRPSPAPVPDPSSRKGQDVPASGDSMSIMLQQYSDMLLTLVQQRMGNQHGSLPPFQQPSQNE